MLSFDESYSPNDESDDDGSDSRSAGTCDFPFCFEKSVGRVGDFVGSADVSVGSVCGAGSGVFIPTGIE